MSFKYLGLENEIKTRLMSVLFGRRIILNDIIEGAALEKRAGCETSPNKRRLTAFILGPCS